jgi:hypothetical protein
MNVYSCFMTTSGWYRAKELREQTAERIQAVSSLEARKMKAAKHPGADIGDVCAVRLFEVESA